jgi:hypothetical protein
MKAKSSESEILIQERPASRLSVLRTPLILCKDPMYLRELSTIAIKPLRIALVHLGLRAGPDLLTDLRKMDYTAA